MSGKQTFGSGKKSSQFGDAWKRLRRNKKALFGMAIVLVILICAIFPNQIARYGPDDQDYTRTLQWPSSDFWFGTDNLGRDIFSRVIYGARISIQVGCISVSIAAIIGSLLGAFAGFYGSTVETIIMRSMDVLMSIPSTLLAISIAAALGPGVFKLMISVGVGSIPTYARIVRAAVLTVKEREFVEAAKAGGASDVRIILRHVFPNCVAPIIVQATMGIAGAILSCAALSFMGLGIKPPTPEWGSMLSTGKAYITNQWYMAVYPGVAIMITILGLNLFGDGLRDALDPRMKR